MRDTNRPLSLRRGLAEVLAWMDSPAGLAMLEREARIKARDRMYEERSRAKRTTKRRATA